MATGIREGSTRVRCLSPVPRLRFLQTTSTKTCRDPTLLTADRQLARDALGVEIGLVG